MKPTVESETDFKVFPREWGIYLPYHGRRFPPREKDLEMLKLLREHFKDREGELLTVKFDFTPLAKTGKPFVGLQPILLRLWRADLIQRFATTFHTISQRPQYISYYIWEDYDVEDNPTRDDSETPVYFM